MSTPTARSLKRRTKPGMSVAALRRRTSALFRTDRIPSELAWVEQLSPLHYRQFLVELHDAVGTAHIADDWDHVVELLEDWRATAEVDADPELAAYLLAPRRGKDYSDYR